MLGGVAIFLGEMFCIVSERKMLRQKVAEEEHEDIESVDKKEKLYMDFILFGCSGSSQ